MSIDFFCRFRRSTYMLQSTLNHTVAFAINNTKIYNNILRSHRINS